MMKRPRVAQQSRISSSINNMDGIVKFLDNKGDDSNKIVFINAYVITKFFINYEKFCEIVNKKR